MKKHKFIILILALAFLIRLGAVGYGLPYLLAFGDEIVHIAAGFSMLAEKTLRADFGFYYNPPLMSYIITPIFVLIGLIGILLGKFQSLLDYQNFVILYKEYFLNVSRVISALLGTGAVCFIFIFAKKLFNSRKIAYLAALFLAFDFFSVHESQIGRFWMSLSFFILASAYFIFRLYKEGNLKWYLLSGLFIGLGFGMGYAAIMMTLWFLTAHFARREKIFNKKFICGSGLLLSLIALFSYLNPVAFVRQFGHMLFTVASFFGKEITFSPIDIPSEVQSSFFYFKLMLGFMWNNSPFFFLLGIFGFLLIGFSKKEKFLNILLIGVPTVYLFIITFLFSGIEARYILPAMPFFILVVSYLLVKTTEYFFRNKLSGNLILILLALIIGSYSFYVSALYTLKLQRPDTRIQAINWVHKNIKPESSIILEERYIELNETKESILFLNEKNSSRMDTKRKYLLNLDETQYPKPKYNIFHLSRLKKNDMDFSQLEVDYLVFSFWEKEEQSRIDTFPYEKELLAKFYPSKKEVFDLKNLLNNPSAKPFFTLNNINYLGPYVEIYKIK